MFISFESFRVRESARVGEGFVWDFVRVVFGKTVYGFGLRSRLLLFFDFEIGFYWGRLFLRSIYVDLVLKYSGDEEVEF